MGIKMSEANFFGQKIKVSEYKEYMKGHLLCIYCGTPITYVSGYIKKVGDRDVQVNPYFRLVNKDHPHKEGCNYITSAVIKKIFAEVADNNLMTMQKNKYIARLHIITKNNEKVKQGTSPAEKVNSVQKKPSQKYINDGEKPAYLQAVKKIVELKEALDNDKELTDLMVLQFYNEHTQKYDEIKWKNFYVDYNSEQYEHIYELIKKQKVYHPICFSGEIKEVKAKVNKKEFYIIKFYALKIVQGEYISLSIITENKEVFDYASRLINKRVVIYGCDHYINAIGISRKGDRETKYYNFTTKINVKAQIFVLD